MPTADKGNEHPVTFLDGRTCKVREDSRVAKNIRKALQNMTTMEAPTGFLIIFDRPVAKSSLTGEGAAAASG